MTNVEIRMTKEFPMTNDESGVARMARCGEWANRRVGETARGVWLCFVKKMLAGFG